MTGADVEAIKFTQTLRGYKASEVDWVLERLGQELDQLRGQVAAVRAAYGIDEFDGEFGTGLDDEFDTEVDDDPDDTPEDAAHPPVAPALPADGREQR